MSATIYHITDTTRPLSEILADSGVKLDLRCGGHGVCGRCRVTLVTGRWMVAGRLVEAPAEANACQARLVSKAGSVSVHDDALLRNATAGSALDRWWETRPLDDCPELTIGCDIGTTTLAVAAIQHGRGISAVSCYNPQAEFGDNVMARISAASEHLAEMRDGVRKALRDLIQLLFPLPSPPARVALAGNSAMICLFHGIDPQSLGAHPFALPMRDFPVLSGDCLGLPDGVPVYTVPPATAFIGGDIVAGLSEVTLQPSDAFMDLGTNCEMVIRLPDGTYCGTAAAAGPAFEGSGISCGSRAVPGAICAYRSPTDMDVVSDAAPTGICGTALVDVLAVWRRMGRLSPFGRLVPPADCGEITAGISLTEEDIAKLVLAKAAVAAGFQTLQKHCGFTPRRLMLAGGFASELNIDNARAIGLLPSIPVVVVENTSLAGAMRLACCPSRYEEMRALHVSEFLLNDDPNFENAFIDAMRL